MNSSTSMDTGIYLFIIVQSFTQRGYVKGVTIYQWTQSTCYNAERNILIGDANDFSHKVQTSYTN